MDFLVVLALATAAAFALRTPLKRMPIVFYLAAAAAVVLWFAGANGLLGVWWRPIIPLVQRCQVALALFTIVMFIGVFPKASRIGGWLRPVRAELSIVACILCLGHVCAYAAPYAQRALFGSMSVSMAVSFCIALILFALLLVLSITSFNAVKRRLSASAWKTVQRPAYLFFALTYVHMVLLLLPAAAVGGAQALTSIVVYSVVFLAYAALRLYRANRERRAELSACAEAGAPLAA